MCLPKISNFVIFAVRKELKGARKLFGAEKQPVPFMHYGLTMNNGWPNSTKEPFCATTSTIVPLTAARTLLKTFMTSINPTVVSSVISWPTLTKGGAPGSGAT